MTRRMCDFQLLLLHVDFCEAKFTMSNRKLTLLLKYDRQIIA